LLDLLPDKKVTIVRREDGFERRVCRRCGRCGVVVGYEVQGAAGGKEGRHGEKEGGGEQEEGRMKAEEGWDGKVLFILPGGVVSTEKMMEGQAGEEDVLIGNEGEGKVVFE